MVCDKCTKKWNCYEACKLAVGWVPLDRKYYNESYKPVGIAYYNPWSERSEAQRRKGRR